MDSDGPRGDQRSGHRFEVFSIKGISADDRAAATHNIPDGEVFTAPVRNSVQGHIICYNAPTIYQGTAFDSVRLEFKDGKIVDASSQQYDEAQRDLG